MKMQRIKLIQLIVLSCMLMLSGYASAQQYDMLQRLNSDLPTSDPYCTNVGGTYPNLPSAVDTSQFSTMGHLCEAVTTSGTNVPTGVVDWVLLELRAATRSGTSADPTDAVGTSVIARKPAFLLRNGRVVDAKMYAELDADNLLSDSPDPGECNALAQDDTCPDVVFQEGNVSSSITNKDLFLVVRHRNHIDIMSNEALTGDSGVYAYDFTTDVTKTKEGADGIKGNARGGRIAMFGGDADYNGTVNATDYSGAVVREQFQVGYRRSDVNFDRTPNATDYSSIILSNRFKTTRVTP